MFINFVNFFKGLWSYYGLKRFEFYYITLHILRGYVYSFCQIFQILHLFKGLSTSIPDSRVLWLTLLHLLDHVFMQQYNPVVSKKTISQQLIFSWKAPNYDQLLVLTFDTAFRARVSEYYLSNGLASTNRADERCSKTTKVINTKYSK